MELLCKVQTYDWGSRDPECHVHQLSRKNDPSKPAETVTGGQLDRPHAEIWVGTHVNGPSHIKGSKKLLSRKIRALILDSFVILHQCFSEYIEENPDSVGKMTQDEFGVQLPFLLKVLSVKKPLSIQAHPLKASKIIVIEIMKLIIKFFN